MPSSELCCLWSTKLIKTLTFIFQIIAPMEFVVNAAIFEKIVQGHPEIDVGNIFVPDEVDPEKSVTDTDEDTGILYLRIVMGKPIGKVRSFSPGFRK